MPTNYSYSSASGRHALHKFSMLRRFSIASLIAMLFTATTLVLFYRYDQISENDKIVAQESSRIAARLLYMLDKQITALITASDGLNKSGLQQNPKIPIITATLNQSAEPDMLKLKIFNLSGTTVYSTVNSEIGKPSSNPDRLANAIRGEDECHSSFRETFQATNGSLHDLYVSERYLPVIHAGKTIGAFEIYADTTPTFSRIKTNTIRIAFIVLSAFLLLYFALFFYVRRMDHAAEEWQKRIIELNRHIQEMAFHDSLTQLPNRRLLNDRLIQSLAALKRSGRYGALMFVDLDNFKPLNDIHGHALGDLLLIEAAERLRKCVREVDTVARFGGDEFVVILSELDADKKESATQASIVAEKIRVTLSEPYVLKKDSTGKSEPSVEHRCTSSIGLVIFNHEASAEEILKRADMAMYQAKDAGRNVIRFDKEQA